MATDLREDVSDVLVRVVGCEPDQVQPSATLSALGVDSLALVEVADELGRRTGGWLPDDELTAARTVGDLERIARDNRGTEPPTWAKQAAAVQGRFHAGRRETIVEKVAGTSTPPPSGAAAKRLIVAMALIGGIIGIGLGAVGVMGADAIGLPDFRMPPLSQSSASPSAPDDSADAGGSDLGGGTTSTPGDSSEPTLVSSANRVKPGERFTLSGRFPGLKSGEVLQVQRRGPNSDWEDFPVTPTTRDGGSFSTSVWTGEYGDFKFRLRHGASNTTSPEVIIKVG